MNLLGILNALSNLLLGVGIVDCWQQASQSKVVAQKAEKLARDKQLREAAKIAEKTLDAWSSQPGFWERLIRRWLLGNLLKQLKQQLEQWHRQISEADKLAAKAKALFKQDTGDPQESQTLSQAIALYQRCTEIVHDENVLLTINYYQQELQQRQQFQQLVIWAKTQAQQHCFKQALARYREAEQLYATTAVQAAIANCEAQVQHEVTYLAALDQAQQAAKQGRLRGAIALLESALSNFPRADGKELSEELRRTIKGKEKFRQGLNAEKVGALKGAASMYAEAKALLSDPTDCLIRLGLVAIKTEDYATALSHLEGVQRDQAAYLRGFAYAKQGNLQQAQRQWHSLTRTIVGYQQDALKSLAQRQRLLALKDIEQLVKDESLEAAKAASEEFLKKFGFDALVQGNLDEHIQPRIETAAWQSSNWGTTTNTVERIWIEQPDIKSLHNWVVAIYYNALAEPHETRDFASLDNFIIALSTALANLHQDPALQNLPWLGNTPVDYDSVFSDLQQRIEEVIDRHKGKNIDEYLKLRDRYRLEMVALSLMGNPPQNGMKVKSVFVTPGCYLYYTHWQFNWVASTKDSQEILRSLYTPWGLAVAACLEGDTQRAIQLKPVKKPTDEAESFARNFVAYYEGCYLLQQQKWREATNPLKQAKKEIKSNTAWQQEVDRLCGLQRQAISELREHLEFAQLWYDLLGSQLAKSYLAEYKAEQIRDKLAKEQISFSQASQELIAVKQIDESNPVVLDLIERVEISQALKEIQEMMQRDRFSEAVRKAKGSKHQRVRYIVAEMCIDILIKGAEARQLPFEVISQLGQWAYELCPDEPTFQEIYRQLKLRY